LTAAYLLRAVYQVLHTSKRSLAEEAVFNVPESIARIIDYTMGTDYSDMEQRER